MDDLLTRYLSGDCQSVRDALSASININSVAEDVALAKAVADEFVGRAIAHLSRLYEFLQSIDYEFSEPASAFVLHSTPSDDSVAEFENRMGKMPLIASRWYKRIKSVDFSQTYGQLTDRESPLAGLGWNNILIVQSLEKSQAHWAEHCKQCAEDDQHRKAAGIPLSGPPTLALCTGGCASNNDCKGFDLPSYRFDDVLYNDGGGDQCFGDEIAQAFAFGGFPVLRAHENTLRVVRTLYGEPDREYLSTLLPNKYEVL